MAKSDIPFSAQFTPNQIHLSRILQIIHDHVGNCTEIEQAIANEFFTGKTELSENTFLALLAYRLLTEDENDPRPTPLQATNLHIILIEKRDLSQLRLQATAIVAILDREAKSAMRLKELKIKLEEI